ncbi:MAG: RidA family protein [Cyclobacteriaceae bacterium]|nr:RidA family protein [Cyclobacteriaceae bacterium]
MGNIVEMSGTTATDEDGQVQGINDPYQQTRYILGKVAKYLQMAGATMEDVIRTRIFVTDISQWEAVGRAHGEFFGDIKPTTSMVEVAKLINPELLVEIEVSAVVHS